MMLGKVVQLRRMILEDSDASNWLNVDLQLIKSNDTILLAFLETNRDIESGFRSIKKWLIWRKENSIVDLKATKFFKEMHQIGFVFLINYDYRGSPVMLIRLCPPSPPKILYPIVVEYFIWTLEKLFRIVCDFGRKPGIVIDCAEARIDITLIKEILNILVFIYPPWAEYVTFCNLSWSFTAVYRIIKAFLPSNLREMVNTGDQTFLQNLTKRKEDLPYYLGGKLWNVTYEDWSVCPSLDRWASSMELDRKQTDDCFKYYKANIPKLGNNWKFIINN